MRKYYAKTKNARPVMQTMRSLQTPVHELYLVLIAFYATTRKKMNQVFTTCIYGKQKIVQETFEFLKNA